MEGVADIYHCLVDRGLQAAGDDATLQRVLLGVNWTLVESLLPERGCAAGLSFSATEIPRHLAWSGTLAGRPAQELVPWLTHSNRCEAALGLATINSLINHSTNSLLRDARPLRCEAHPHLAVFDHFAPQLAGANVVIIGRYPFIDDYKKHFDFACIERRPGPDDLPETAASWALPRADWVFITASSIANQTLPQLLALSRHARVVLMGPSLPWLPDWADLGVDYLAGVSVEAPSLLQQIVAEAGGTRIFSSAVQYRLLSLS